MDQLKYRVSEIFGPTLQGEGRLFGHPVFFVRFGGCDYRCDWCDTLYAVLPEEVKRLPTKSSAEIFRELDALKSRGSCANWVILTGGNPLVWDLDEFVNCVYSEHYHFSVETQGSIWRDWLPLVDHVSISPKPPSSKMTIAHPNWDGKLKVFIAKLEDGEVEHDLKVVIFEDDDILFAKHLRTLFPQTKMYLSIGTYSLGTPYSEGKRLEIDTPDEMLMAAADLWEKLKHDPLLSDCPIMPQYHVLLWGHGRGV